MKKLLLTLALLLCLTAPIATQAKQAQSVLFDSETMAWLKDLATPLLKTAEIDPKTVNFYIIKSDEINAFVTPNNDIFFYSGLILKATSAEEVRGVLAHEIGHIKGNHYLKTLAKSDKKTVPLIIGTILGVGAAALGSAEGAVALITGGLAGAQDQALRHSRTHERQADNIAAKLLNENNFSVKGLLSFFEKLRVSNLLYSRTPPAWLVSHPLPRQRISTMMDHAKKESLTDTTVALDEKRFKRIQAKLIAFTKSTGFTMRKYAYKDNPEARYAKAITLALQGKTDDSIALIKSMNPGKASLPFHYEILAQLYQDKSDYDTANVALTKALSLNHNLEFIRLQLAENLIILNKYDEAIKHLHTVEHLHPTWSGVQHSLGIAYGKKGELFKSHIFLAKEAKLLAKPKDIKLHIQLAKKYMEKGNKTQQKSLKETKELLIDDEKS